MADAYYAKHPHVGRDVEQLAHIVLRLLSVFVEAFAHLDPATAQAKVLRLHLYCKRCNRRILNPRVAFIRICSHHNGERTSGNRARAKLLAFAELFKGGFVVDSHKLPRHLAL